MIEVRHERKTFNAICKAFSMIMHSYATSMMKNGLSNEFIFDSVGQANVKTTENYLSSFDEEVKRGFCWEVVEFWGIVKNPSTNRF
jgi:hypothetical protein